MKAKPDWDAFCSDVLVETRTHTHIPHHAEPLLSGLEESLDVQTSYIETKKGICHSEICLRFRTKFESRSRGDFKFYVAKICFVVCKEEREREYNLSA